MDPFGVCKETSLRGIKHFEVSKFSKSVYSIGLFETLKMFYPPKGRLPADSSRVQLFLLIFYFGLGNVYWTFRFCGGNRLFQILRLFYPSKRRLPEDSSRGPIVFTYVLFWVRKTLEAFLF